MGMNVIIHRLKYKIFFFCGLVICTSDGTWKEQDEEVTFMAHQWKDIKTNNLIQWDTEYTPKMIYTIKAKQIWKIMLNLYIHIIYIYE